MEKYGTDEQFYISDIDYRDTRYTATIVAYMGGQELSGKRHLGQSGEPISTSGQTDQVTTI